MRVTEHVDIPDELMRAQHAGELALFVGAGASMASPSNLPTFDGLAAYIAEQVGASFVAGVDNPNQFLSDLDVRGLAVHELARQRIAEADEPNAIHEALVGLFPRAEDLRIVTTNWDTLLTTAAQRRFGTTPRIYRSPALPLGRDFTGIVHLHGCLDQQPSDLIMTEPDFGRAYLTDAWAARFVHELFRSYAVLFVGYSNEDTIMFYLGRGLTASSRRW